MHLFIYVVKCVYIYIYIERERQREAHTFIGLTLRDRRARRAGQTASRKACQPDSRLRQAAFVHHPLWVVVVVVYKFALPMITKSIEYPTLDFRFASSRVFPEKRKPAGQQDTGRLCVLKNLRMGRYLGAAVLGWHYLSNVTCLIRPHFFYALFIASSSFLKKVCVRQVGLDRWFPLKYGCSHPGS